MSCRLARCPASSAGLQACRFVVRSAFRRTSIGDFKSNADGTGAATYGNLLAAGFTDAWSAVHPTDPGATCCQLEDLLNTTSTLSSRIDLVLFRTGQP